MLEPVRGVETYQVKKFGHGNSTNSTTSLALIPEMIKVKVVVHVAEIVAPLLVLGQQVQNSVGRKDKDSLR